MIFELSNLPIGINTVEKLVVWGVQVLASQQYAALELTNQSGPVAPVFERVSRSPSGPNYGKPFFEFGGYIPLDGEIYPSQAPYHAAEPFNDAAGHFVPNRFMG